MRKALIVGIEKYPESCLNGCAKDADSMTRLLEKHENGSRNFTVNKIKNNLTKGKLKEQIYKLFKQKCDIALFYFSGHGHYDEFGFHLVTSDVLPHDVGVSMADLMDVVNDSPARNKVVILDCCYAGGAGRHKYNRNGNKITLLGNGVTVLASCGKEEEAMMKVGEGGIFTRLLIEALEGGSADLHGNITPGSIYAFVDKALGPKQQRPEFKTNISEFISLRKVAPPIPATTLYNIVSFFNNPKDEFDLDPSFEFTNYPKYKTLLREPYKNVTNIKKLEQLQAMNRVGLVKPVGAKHMYFAAMNSKSCKLTPLGQHYWRLINQNKSKRKKLTNGK